MVCVIRYLPRGNSTTPSVAPAIAALIALVSSVFPSPLAPKSFTLTAEQIMGNRHSVIQVNKKCRNEIKWNCIGYVLLFEYITDSLVKIYRTKLLFVDTSPVNA